MNRNSSKKSSSRTSASKLASSLILHLTLLWSPTLLAQNARWAVAGTNVGVLVEFDANSILRGTNDGLTVVTRWELTKHIAEMPTLKGFLQLNEILCQSRQIRTLELRAYEVWPPAGKPASFDNVPSPWIQAAKNTFYDGVMTNVCREFGQ